MQLSEELKDCLRQVLKEQPDLDFEDTVRAGFTVYLIKFGRPVQVEDDEEGVELVKACLNFVMDELIAELILDGIFEVKGIKDGKFTYGLAGVEPDGNGTVSD